MSTFLIKVLIILTVFASSNLFAILEVDEEDVKLSKKTFLISGAAYNEKNKNNGAMTLCFKAPKRITAKKKYLPAEYIRYASWVLPNEDLFKGCTRASTDDDEHKNNHGLYNSYTSIGYAQRIMGEVGLTGVDLGWWRESSNNLKLLVDQYITPRPDHKVFEEINQPTIH